MKWPCCWNRHKSLQPRTLRHNNEQPAKIYDTNAASIHVRTSAKHAEGLVQQFIARVCVHQFTRVFTIISLLDSWNIRYKMHHNLFQFHARVTNLCSPYRTTIEIKRNFLGYLILVLTVPLILLLNLRSLNNDNLLSKILVVNVLDVNIVQWNFHYGRRTNNNRWSCATMRLESTRLIYIKATRAKFGHKNGKKLVFQI